MVTISKKVKVVILDFVKTLVEEKLNWNKLREINCQIFKKYGIDVEPQSLRPIIEQTASQLKYLEQLNYSNKQILQLEKLLLHAQEKFEKKFIKLFSPFEDTGTFLNYVSENNLKIGILTNNFSTTVMEVFSSNNIPFQGHIIGRGDVKEPKPNLEGISKLLKILGAKPSETILIGDSDFDIDVARQTGIYAIYLKRFKNMRLSYAKANKEINTLSEISITP